jgi:uncharacterized protein
MINKKKIINDPVLGFISINSELVFDLIEHPYFQRLRRIKQLGLTNFVYPAANHSRFQHALGSYHLINEAISIIRSKGQEITDEEAEAASVAILLHDIGHGPFSHALENSIMDNIGHEKLSTLFMEELNIQFDKKLDMAIAIFTNKYHKKFLHQLISSQLDMDRLDYLKRDSFFTGVSEGVVGSDRIIKMLNVVDDKLVVESKGIYSIEKFLIARRLMYWQVYLHKTVLSAEYLLINILKKAKQLAKQGEELFATPALHFFLYNNINENSLNSYDSKKKIMHQFSKLDDYDIVASIKVWNDSDNKCLKKLCANFLDRNLYKIELQPTAFDSNRIKEMKNKLVKLHGITLEDADFFVFSDCISNNAYKMEDETIEILFNNGKLTDICNASDIFNPENLSRTTKKYFLCYPKELIV